MHRLFNCFKIIIYAIDPVPVSLNYLQTLNSLEERNDISDTVQKLNSDCSLMELIYVSFSLCFCVYDSERS